MFSFSDYALLDRAKRKNFKKKPWISRMDFYLITFDQNGLWKYYRFEPALNNGGTLANFSDNSASFKFKQKSQVQQKMIGQKLFK